MTSSTTGPSSSEPATPQRRERASSSLLARGFSVEILDHAATVTETGSAVAASATGSQLVGYAGGAARVVWVDRAQKIVPDRDTALRRVEAHALPLESARAQKIHGRPSVVNRLLITSAQPLPGRGVAMLLCEAIGVRPDGARATTRAQDPVVERSRDQQDALSLSARLR